MKILVVRGDFGGSWELQNFEGLTRDNEVDLATGFYPVNNLTGLDFLSQKRFFSPVDLNFRKISRLRMAILNRFFGDAHYLFGLEKILGNYDVVHVAETYYGYTQQAINAKLEGKIKNIVSTVWENKVHNNETISGRKEYKNKAFENIDIFLPVTERAREVLIEEGCPKEKIKVLMPGINLEKFKRTEVKEFKEFKKIDGVVDFLFVGRLIREKGILEVVEFFNKSKILKENARLFVVGEGPLVDKVRGENIFYLGSLPYQAMPEIYSFCNVFCHFPIGSKTWDEQFGMVLVEALACGMALVCLDKGSILEVVGNSGIVIGQENFLESLERVTRDNTLREKLGKLAVARAKTKFDSKKYSRELEKIYKCLKV